MTKYYATTITLLYAFILAYSKTWYIALPVSTIFYLVRIIFTLLKSKQLGYTKHDSAAKIQYEPYIHIHKSNMRWGEKREMYDYFFSCCCYSLPPFLFQSSDAFSMIMMIIITVYSWVRRRWLIIQSKSRQICVTGYILDVLSEGKKCALKLNHHNMPSFSALCLLMPLILLNVSYLRFFVYQSQKKMHKWKKFFVSKKWKGKKWCDSGSQ